YPLWSPDGASILYYSNSASGPGLYMQRGTGAGNKERVLPGDDELVPTDWTKDGRVIYEKTAAHSGQDLWMLPLSGDRKPLALVQGAYDEMQGRVSPDGHWLAYTSTETGRSEVYVQSFPDPGGKWQISTHGGADPMWSPNGRELFYISPDQQMID